MQSPGAVDNVEDVHTSMSTRSNKTRVFEAMYATAWHLYKTKQFDKAFRASSQILEHTDLGPVLAAGLHVILSNSDDCQVEHAGRAIKLLEMSYKKPDKTDAQSKIVQRMINSARGALKKAIRAEADQPVYTVEQAMADIEEDTRLKREMQKKIAEQEKKLAMLADVEGNEIDVMHPGSDDMQAGDVIESLEVEPEMKDTVPELSAL